MGNCIYCGEKAGFLSKRHKECQCKFDIGKSDIISLIKQIGKQKLELSSLKNEIINTAKQSFIDEETLTNLYIQGFELLVDEAFEDGVLSADEEENFLNFMEHFNLSQNVVDKNGYYTKIVKGSVLRDVFNGIIPQRMQITDDLPFNLQKSEQIIWLFTDVKYYEQRTRTQYVGGSRGVSVRLAKGLYYRVGAFKGERIQTSEIRHTDTGLLGVTQKHIYFYGLMTTKIFKVPYSKIVAFQPFEDGIGIQKDAATAKPQSFVTGDGWFTYNLITNLAKAC